MKKNTDTLRSKQANNHRDPQIILKLLSSRQHEQRAWIIPTESLRVTQQILVLWSSAWKCSMAVWRGQHYFNFVFGIVAQFLVWYSYWYLLSSESAEFLVCRSRSCSTLELVIMSTNTQRVTLKSPKMYDNDLNNQIID